jgi:hypothetical protein
MIDPVKFQYFTMANRLYGFAKGLEQADTERISYGDRPRNVAEIAMLMKAAAMLTHAWKEYAEANNIDIQVEVEL